MSEHWEGVDGVLANLDKAGGNAQAGAREGMMVAGRNTLNVSNSQVPHEEGDLERDGGYSMDDSKLLLAVSYGRSADTAPYAVPQHERMDYHHDAGRNAKYLENALNSTRQQNVKIIQSAIKRKLGT